MFKTIFGRLWVGAGGIAFSIGLAVLTLGSGSTALAQGATPPGLDRALAAKAAHAAEILAIDGVVGLGVGLSASGDAAVVVTTARRNVAGIRRSLDGVAVRVLVTGPFNANPKPNCGFDPTHPSCGDSEEDPTALEPTDRWPQPVPIGVSSGNSKLCSSGTIGARVIDVNGNFYALSNNHVFALESTGDPVMDLAVLGDDIRQPGLFDTGCGNVTKDTIGTLADFVPINFDGVTYNYVDAAIAATTTGHLRNVTPPDGYDKPNSITIAAQDALDLKVQKYGRTTGLTKGTVVIVGWMGNVGYTNGTALFDDQIVIYSRRKVFLRAGDSGSLVVTNDKFANPVGLLFAGDGTGKYGIANPIDAVLAQFGVTIDDGEDPAP